MTAPDVILCKPTRWFLLRAAAMLTMFGVFAVLFFIDGSSGYRKKNHAYYIQKAFQDADADFARLQGEGELSAERWKEHAASRTVTLPEDPYVLPADLPRPLPWPEILHDYEKMKPLQWNTLWREYSGKAGLNEKVREKPYTAREIGEQWVVFWICLALALLALFFLFRTLRRNIQADHEAITSQQGKRVPYTELTRLDLRKWDTKGIAFADYDGPTAGKGRIRIDGLTYGGFRVEENQPAEQLMERLRSHFAGEIIEYAPISAEEPPAETDPTAPENASPNPQNPPANP